MSDPVTGRYVVIREVQDRNGDAFFTVENDPLDGSCIFNSQIEAASVRQRAQAHADIDADVFPERITLHVADLTALEVPGGPRYE